MGSGAPANHNFLAFVKRPETPEEIEDCMAEFAEAV